MFKYMMLKIGKIRFVSFLVCFGVQIGLCGAMAASDQNGDVSLLLEVEKSSVSSHDRLNYSVTLKNNGDKPLDFSVTNVAKPFSETLWDSNGNDLMDKKFISRRKDRSTPEIKISIPGGEKKVYISSLDLKKLDTSILKKTKDKLTLEITFPLVRYQAGQYKVTLVRSNKIKINIE